MPSDTDFAPAASIRSLRDRVGSFVAAVHAIRRARRDQACLSQMSDQMLDDIGLTRVDIRQVRRSPSF